MSSQDEKSIEIMEEMICLNNQKNIQFKRLISIIKDKYGK